MKKKNLVHLFVVDDHQLSLITLKYFASIDFFVDRKSLPGIYIYIYIYLMKLFLTSKVKRIITKIKI